MDQAGLSLKEQRDVLKEIGGDYDYEAGCKELTKFSRSYSKRSRTEKKPNQREPTKSTKQDHRDQKHKKPFFRKFQKHQVK